MNKELIWRFLLNSQDQPSALTLDDETLIKHPRMTWHTHLYTTRSISIWFRCDKRQKKSQIVLALRNQPTLRMSSSHIQSNYFANFVCLSDYKFAFFDKEINLVNLRFLEALCYNFEVAVCIWWGLCSPCNEQIFHYALFAWIFEWKTNLYSDKHVEFFAKPLG